MKRRITALALVLALFLAAVPAGASPVGEGVGWLETFQDWTNNSLSRLGFLVSGVAGGPEEPTPIAPEEPGGGIGEGSEPLETTPPSDTERGPATDPDG